MSKIPAINEIDANSPSQESTEVVVKATTVTPDINEIQETISASATIQEIDGTRKPTISEIYKIVNDGLFESTTNWWDYAYKLSQAQLNQDIISRLDNGVIGGGYSKGVEIITTTSNKVPSNTNVYSALKSDSLYPKKLNDEVINGIYDFLNGLTIGKPTAYTGGTWSVDQTGKTHLTTDYLYVRLKAIFETLQILNIDTIGGKLVISPAGSIRVAYVDRIRIDAPVFKHDENTDVWSISQVEDAEGNFVNETLNQEVYRCYFLGEQDGEEIDNKWKVGDQAQAKTFNVKKGTYHKVENSYLWRLVVNVSSDTVDIDGKKYHYVDLSQIDFDSGSDAPAPGDVLNQLGHRLNDTQRQTALVLNAVDNYAPSITLYAGVNYYTLLNKEYVEFGVYNGKAFFNVYGDMYIGDKGTNPKTYIKYKNGKINIKANLEIGSSIGDKDLDQYIKENGGVDENKVLDIINNSQVIIDLQKQTDGAIETWFYEGVPTLDNLPAVDWTTGDLKKKHIGDLYYDQTTGYAYRFTKYNDDVNPYRWNRIKDNDIVAALDAASRAQITADGKMKVFYGKTKPTNYQVGDMWVNATLEGKFNNDIARAVADNKTSFNANDWVLASRYSEAIATIQKWTNEYETKFSNLVDEVKQQKDQSIVVWYYGYEPTVNNAPANTWNTDELRSEHIGDIFYDIKNNHSYRWTGTTWIQIKDADFDEAMKAAKAADDKAGAAGDLADSKRRIFYSDTTPTEPFDKGDLWIKQVGDKTETWVYNGTDWVKSDDKALNDFKNTINDELTGIKGQLDGKAETWYQVDDPSTDWTDKVSHEGDIWYNTSNGTTNYWNGSAWEQMDIPKDVFDTIDGKSSIFVDSYADAKAGTGVISKGYKERDLWILPEDATVNGVKYYKGDMLTAVSKNTNFDETNWKKKVRYVGPTELNKAIDVVNEKINTINNITIPGINNKFNEFIEDGVLDSSEKARLTDLLNQASNEVAAVIDQVNNITTSKYLTNDNANKGKLKEANTVMKTAWTEYKNLINTLIAANTEITKVNIGEANTKYRNLQEKIKTVKQYLAICQADILSGMGTDITSYKYIKDALNQTTEINGGLVLTSAIQLKDVDKKVTAGMNGIVKGDKTSIAAWYGGPMVDRDTFTSEELKTKVPGTDYAMSLLRHDGTGYLAGGNIHWNANGVLSGNFNSFILQGTSMVTIFYYIRLFYLHNANQDSTDFNNIDYVTPMKTFSRLSVLPLGGVEGGNKLPTGLFIGDSNTGGSFQIGNIILRTKSGDPNILEIVSASSNKTAHLGVQGGISAYGTYTPSTGGGGGGGLNGSVKSYSSALKLTSESLSEIASAYSIKALDSRISSLEGGSATAISVSGSGNAVTSVTKNGTTISVVKGSTFLTAHQSLAGYMKTATADAKYMYHSRNNIVSDLNSFATNGAAHIYEMNNVTNRPNSNSWVQVMNWGTGDSAYGFLLANDYSINGHMYFRQKIAGSWKDWKTIIDSSNIGAQSVNYAASAGSVAWTNVSGRPSTMKNPSALSWSGYSSGSYDGSAAKSISIPNNTNQLTNGAGFITASASITGNAATATKVNHSLSVFSKSFNGSANVTVADTDLIASISTGTANLTDKTEILTSYASNNGFNNSNAKNRIYRRPASAIWGYINGKTISNADKLDNVHLNGIFTALSNTNNGVSMTIGTVAKSLANMQVYSATKLVTARNIALNGDFTGNANFDGSANITINGYMSHCNATVSNTNTYPWRRIAKVNEITGNYSDGCILLYISEGFNGGYYGIARVYIRTDNLSTGANASCSIQWISRNGYGLDSLKIAMYKTTGKAYYDVFLKMSRTYGSVVIRTLQDQRGGLGKRFTLVNSTETANAASHTEAYATIEDAATAIHNQAYTSIAQGSDVATVHNADMVDGIHASGLFTNLSNSGNSLSITVGGTNKTLTVNYASSAGNADTVDGYHATSGRTFDGNINWSPNWNSTWSDGTHTHPWYGFDHRYPNTGAYSTTITDYFGMTIKTANTLRLDFGTLLLNGTDIHNINVASASKLATARSIWGQSFDGTGNVNGTIYINNSDSENGAIILNNNVNTHARISAIKDQVVFNTGAAIRFGATNWEYSDWAGLKYDTVANAIYLGIADGTVFNCYSNKRSNGTLKFPGITTITPDSGARIGGSGGDLYLGNANNSNWVKVQDICSHNGSNYWYIHQSGDAHFSNINVVGTATIGGDCLVKGGVTAYQSSDVRLKTNITKLNCLKVIKSIGGTYEFDYIREHKHSIGFIAQNVNNPLLNDIVAKDDNGYLKINYWNPKLISLAFGALTEIDDEVDKLKARVRELESEVEYLKNKAYALQ